MKKHSLMAVLTIVSSAALANDGKTEPFIEAKVGYFYPFSSALRETVGGGTDYQLSFTYPFWRQVSIFASVDFFTKKGHSTGDHSKATLWIMPFTLGVKTLVPIYQSKVCDRQFDLYFALAPRYYISRAINHADYVDHSNFAQCAGGMGSTGAVYFYKHLTITAFLDVSFGNIHSHTSIANVETPNTQVGGLVAGGGVGYKF
jgi:hypothetical protein